MLLLDERGRPISELTLSANIAEVNTIETLIAVRVNRHRPERVLYDRAADADWLCNALDRQGTELICPHRKGRKKPPIQDGRSLRKYRHRWIIERTIGWLQNFRRLIVRHEYHEHLFEGFVTFGCMAIILRGF